MLVRIGVAAATLGVCPKTLRCWEAQGYLAPARTAGGHRRYDSKALHEFAAHGSYAPKERGSTGVAAVYARVSAPKQRDDLARQRAFLEARVQRDGYVPKAFVDVGSGLNDQRQGLLRLVRAVLAGAVDAVYVTYPDRLARFGTQVIRAAFGAAGVPLVVAGETPEGSPGVPGGDARLVADMIALVTSFAGKVHRARRGRTAPGLRGAAGSVAAAS
jgi:predicted site-specific integrase-resolvase